MNIFYKQLVAICLLLVGIIYFLICIGSNQNIYSGLSVSALSFSISCVLLLSERPIDTLIKIARLVGFTASAVSIIIGITNGQFIDTIELPIAIGGALLAILPGQLDILA